MSAKRPDLTPRKLRRILAALRRDRHDDEVPQAEPAEEPAPDTPGAGMSEGPLYEEEDLAWVRELAGTPTGREALGRWEQRLADLDSRTRLVVDSPADLDMISTTADRATLDAFSRGLAAALELAPHRNAREFVGLDPLLQMARSAQDKLAQTRTTFQAQGYEWTAQVDLRGIVAEFLAGDDAFPLRAAGAGEREPIPPVETQPVWYTALPLPPRSIRWATATSSAGWNLTLGPDVTRVDTTWRVETEEPAVNLPESLQTNLALETDHYWTLHAGSPGSAPVVVRGIFRILRPDDAIASVLDHGPGEEADPFRSELRDLHRLLESQLYDVVRRRVRRLLDGDLEPPQRLYLFRMLGGIYREIHAGLAARLQSGSPEVRWASDRARSCSRALGELQSKEPGA